MPKRFPFCPGCTARAEPGFRGGSAARGAHVFPSTVNSEAVFPVFCEVRGRAGRGGGSSSLEVKLSLVVAEQRPQEAWKQPPLDFQAPQQINRRPPEAILSCFLGVCSGKYSY